MRDFSELTIQGLNKSFGAKPALTDFSLSLKRGEFVTFLGPSGCGKSTALNCIAGLIPITSGRISVDDECIDDGKRSLPAEKRDFGMVFQNYALFPHLNVFNNVAFGLQLKKLPRLTVRDKVTDVLKMVHLRGYERKFPSQMSGGEQQRVAIARCIVMEPRLLMLDEPLSNLDAKLRIDMRYELKSLHKRLHITSIYVTHDQQEALALSDRIVVMRNGEIQQIGTPEAIYAQPDNLFVADFMGFRNIWPARIETFSDTAVTVEFQGVRLVARNIHLNKSAITPLTPVLTAIRPEDLQVGEGQINRLECKADVVEYLGQISQVAAVTESGTRVDIRPAVHVESGEHLKLWIPPEKIHIFPREEG